LKAGHYNLLPKVLNDGYDAPAEDARFGKVRCEVGVDGNVAWLKSFIYRKTTAAGYDCGASISMVKGFRL